MIENPYIRFELRTKRMPEVKTEVWGVVSKRTGMELAVVKWFAPWRRYALFPSDDTIWDAGCLFAVQEHIEMLHRMRANVRANQGKDEALRGTRPRSEHAP